MKNTNFWIILALFNLCIVALLGFTLRTDFLFPLPFIDYKNLLSAHSHFAFGGWVTLVLMILFIERLLSPLQKQKKIYQWLLWGTEISATGMLLTFPFQGYGLFSIIFSTLFIFFTYGFTWVFIADLRKTNTSRPVKLLAIVSLLCLSISSAGPFNLAYMMASHSGDAILYRNSIYTYLHFQYNGFFTLGILALFSNQFINEINDGLKKRVQIFAILLSLSILPTLFLSLLWTKEHLYVQLFSILGCGLIILSILSFLSFCFRKEIYRPFPQHSLAKGLLLLSLVSFGIKMILQTGTIIPELRNAVFGFRPIIIGFLHLVFLGQVTFYFLSHFLVSGFFPKNKFSLFAILYFAGAIIMNEMILLVEGIGLLLLISDPIYPWLLWGAAMLLFTGASLLFMAKTVKKMGGGESGVGSRESVVRSR